MTSGPDTFRVLLGSVVNRNGGKWHRFILTILRNEADAEDVIQEAVRRVLSRNVSLHSEDQVRMYLGRAVANAALELYNCRKKERLQQQSISDPLNFSCRRSSPCFHMEEREQIREKERLLGLLDQGLQRLPPKQYEAVRLTILESGELSIRDVGALNGIPYSTLRHRSKEGLKHLRRFLKAKIRSQVSRQSSAKAHWRLATDD